MSELLNGRELAALLGISSATYDRYRRAGSFRQFEARQPIGHKRYLAALVRQFLAGQSVVGFGSGSRRFRRAS